MLYPIVQNAAVFPVEIRIGPRVEMISDLLGQSVVEIQIVHDCEPHPEHFLRFEQMA